MYVQQADSNLSSPRCSQGLSSLQVNSETDFVARTDDFRLLVSNVAQAALHLSHIGACAAISSYCLLSLLVCEIVYEMPRCKLCTLIMSIAVVDGTTAAPGSTAADRCVVIAMVSFWLCAEVEWSGVACHHQKWCCAQVEGSWQKVRWKTYIWQMIAGHSPLLHQVMYGTPCHFKGIAAVIFPEALVPLVCVLPLHG